MPQIEMVSVIVTTKNEEKNLPRLLSSIRKQTYKPIELIIVDNFSSDQTYNISQQYTSFVYQHGPERCTQRNFAVQKSHGMFILFLDADMEIPPPCIALCVKTAKVNDCVGIIIPEDIPAQNFFSRIKKLEKKLYIGETTIEAARFFRKKVFTQVGGYNEDLIAGEDWELSTRIQRKGTIGRISVSLFHYETSFIRELKHKWYYAKQIQKYERVSPSQFARQSDFNRLLLFLKKKEFYTANPLIMCGLLLLKTIEYFMFKYGQLDKYKN